jgi:putative PIN family toxin of toxin-antitoxin system
VIQVVIDTNVLVAALRSQRGAAHRLLRSLDEGRWQANLSVPLLLEYEDVVKRPGLVAGLSAEEIDDILDYICAVANRREIFYLWRPALPDPKDDFILELAVEGGCDFIITYNVRDFAGAEKFGIQVVTPQQFFERLEEAR